MLASIIAITTSASSAALIDLSIPIFSIILSVFRIPAVSIILTGIPSICINSSIVSLVVPSISVTIARSVFNIAFKSEDLPAFGFPN